MRSESSVSCSESTISPSSPDIARSTPHSHDEFPITVQSPQGSSFDESARVDRAIHTYAGPRPPFEQMPQNGFLFSSAGSSYLSAEFPNNAPDGCGLAYAVAAAWGMPPSQDGWHLPAAAQDGWHRPPPAASDASEASTGGGKVPVAEDGGCDLSFLCAEIQAVACEPG